MWMVKLTIGIGLVTVGPTVAGEGTVLSWIAAILGLVIILSSAIDYSRDNP